MDPRISEKQSPPLPSGTVPRPSPIAQLNPQPLQPHGLGQRQILASPLALEWINIEPKRIRRKPSPMTSPAAIAGEDVDRLGWVLRVRIHDLLVRFVVAFAVVELLVVNEPVQVCVRRVHHTTHQIYSCRVACCQ